MYKITKKEMLTDVTALMDVYAPRVAASCQPGQFIIVKIDEFRAQIESFREKTLGSAHFFVPLRFSDTLHNSLERYREFRENFSVGNIRDNIKDNIRENIDKIKRK